MQVENNYPEHRRSSEVLMHAGRALFHIVCFLLNMGKIWSEVELCYCSPPQQPCKARGEGSLHLRQAPGRLRSWDLSECPTKRNHTPLTHIPQGPSALRGTATSMQAGLQGK